MSLLTAGYAAYPDVSKENTVFFFKGFFVLEKTAFGNKRLYSFKIP
jgi:hypothetical protein